MFLFVQLRGVAAVTDYKTPHTNFFAKCFARQASAYVPMQTGTRFHITLAVTPPRGVSDRLAESLTGFFKAGSDPLWAMLSHGMKGTPPHAAERQRRPLHAIQCPESVFSVLTFIIDKSTHWLHTETWTAEIMGPHNSIPPFLTSPSFLKPPMFFQYALDFW